MKTTKVRNYVWKRQPQKSEYVPRTLPELRRWLKAIGAKPVDAATKRRLIAAGEWGMPKE
ncbi:MAG: hypothetical protein HY736_14375 [Verrucomicrobia bacterium]|nr:hypothetical protein [Verrucomicrobiota bacterium]